MSILSRVLRQLPQAPKELDLFPQIEQLVNAQDWTYAQQVVTENPALLGDLASALILELAAAARQQGNEAVALTLEDYLPLLESARDQGIEQAFREAAEFDGIGPDAAHEATYPDVPPALAPTLQRALAAQALFAIASQREDLSEAATLWRALTADPRFAQTAPGFRLAVHKSAALALARRFELSGDTTDLDDAIDHWQSAARLSREDPADHASCLTYLGHTLQARTAARPATADADFDAAVAAYREARQQSGGRGKAIAAANLAAGLRARYQRTGQDADLDEAIDWYAEARRTLPLYARASDAALSGQGRSLLARFRLRSEPSDLDEAITALRLSAQRTPPDAPEFPERLYDLARALTARYDLCGDDGALDEAISSLQTAIQLTPDGRPELQRFAETLGGCLRRFYATIGLAL